jgi:hypothetical protein
MPELKKSVNYKPLDKKITIKRGTLVLNLMAIKYKATWWTVLKTGNLHI